MRGDRGRFFPPKYEARRMDRDIEKHQQAFGTSVDWYFYDAQTSTYDDIYDEGQDITGGRRWKGPVLIPVLSAIRREGGRMSTDDGQYTLDVLDIRISHEQARRVGLAPEMSQNHESHLNDRIVYDRRVFGIRDIQITGQFEESGHDVIVRVQAVQLRPDELVNDPDFVRWSA